MKVEPTPKQVSTAIWAVSRPLMQTDRWCVNAASICRAVLRELRVPSWPVHAEVMHLNAAYAEALREQTGEQPDGYEARPVWPGQTPYMTYARLDVISSNDVGAAENAASPDGLAGHVLTFVPAWRCYLDPSGHQFTREPHGIVIPPGHAWEGIEAPAPRAWQRPDGGVTAIEPTGLKRFKNAPGWQVKPYHALLTREVMALLKLPLSGDTNGSARP